MRFLSAVTITLLLAGNLQAENWSNWRGPTLNGVAAGKDYPVEWSTSKNVVWKAALPGQGSSTPVVWGDRIFVTAAKAGKNATICLDRWGKQLWETFHGNEKEGKHRKASGSNSSPVTDGKHVYVYFKSGDFACLDYAGKVVWQHNLQDMFGEDTLWWDLGTSPILTENHVVVACMHSGPSYLAAFDKTTGSVAWKQDRDLGAPSEAAQSYTTPVVISENGKETIVVLGADHVTAHDARTGKEKWRVGDLNPTQNGYFRSISSPVVAEGIVVAPYARGGSLTAIALGGKGDVTKSKVLWSVEKASADVATPVAINGKVYVCTDKGDVICLNLKTGSKLWEHKGTRVRGKYYSSPVLADGRIYVTYEDGRTFVLDANNKGKLLATNSLDEMTVTTPVFVDGKLLLRTEKHLYCIGK